MDDLHETLATLVEAGTARGEPAIVVYAAVREAVGLPPIDTSAVTRGRPRLTESWFCCAEPTDSQLETVTR